MDSTPSDHDDVLQVGKARQKRQSSYVSPDDLSQLYGIAFEMAVKRINAILVNRRNGTLVGRHVECIDVTDGTAKTKMERVLDHRDYESSEEEWEEGSSDGTVSDVSDVSDDSAEEPVVKVDDARREIESFIETLCNALP